MKIELHIFTNFTNISSSGELIKNTVNSFNAVFNPIYTTVWCHADIKNNEHLEYIDILKLNFANVNISKSLSDGYVKAVTTSNSDYLFMLEHDWNFLNNITHSLDNVINQMEDSNLLHLRFNKLDNTVNRWDSSLAEITGKYFSYCITPALSNNPHLINRKKYIEQALPVIMIRKGAKGLEERLTFRSNLTGAIYGSLNFPKTISHTDGRGAYVNRSKL